MTPTIISIPGGDELSDKENRCLKSFVSHKLPFTKQGSKKRQIIHSIKVGIALVTVSLLYLLDPLYKQVKENAMWAIMTVVVVYEFYAGATLSKGLNRGAGTILGGGFGCLAAVIALKVGGVGNSITIGIFVFIFGAAATYTRQLPSIKKRYDYGVMIFILTFNLVVVSGVRGEEVIKLSSVRLSAIGIGFAICSFTSLFIFPMWASEELHFTLASEFDTLAHCIGGFFEEYFKQCNEKEYQCGTIIDDCKKVLYAKSKDESLANFARWEPWHGNFGLSYPWDKYLEIGDNIRELAAIILSLKAFLQSPKETSSSMLPRSLKEPFEAVTYSIAWTLQELGQSIINMKKCLPLPLVNPKLKSMRLELTLMVTSFKSSALESSERLEIASSVFLLISMIEKVEILVKEVEELGELAGFHPR